MPTEPRDPGRKAAPVEWPGKRRGLPASGRLSVARLGRRIAALLVDQAPAYLIAFVFFRSPDGIIDGLALTVIFAVLQIVFIPTIGGSLGHRLLGMRLVAVGGGWIGPWRPVVRTLLLLLVVPAAIWDTDQRGLHDKLAGTVLVRF